MAKNIEMNHLNSDGSYEVLYPKTMANITYPSSNTLSLLGLSENSNVDDAFNALYTPVNSLYERFCYQEFLESVTWKAPSNILNNRITVLCCGGGGGGGGSASTVL